jgi:glycosyltransferase involved in cell wall biosynthesis
MQTLDAFYGEHLCAGVPLVGTDMEMIVGGMMPKSPYITYGTPEVVDRARQLGYRHAELLLPPVDLAYNSPAAVAGASFRTDLGLGDDSITMVTVSRLDDGLKGESLFRTVAVVRELGRDLPLRLVIVGDGDIRIKLEETAAAVNAELGRTAVLLTGTLIDPRPAYAAADIIVGMGGSALRGMAFRKPVVVVGERGFSALLNHDSAPTFHYQGLFGIGDGAAGNSTFVEIIRRLCNDRSQFATLGQFSYSFVSEHFGLEAVSARLCRIYAAAVENRRPAWAALSDGAGTAVRWTRQRRFLPREWSENLAKIARRA